MLPAILLITLSSLRLSRTTSFFDFGLTTLNFENLKNVVVELVDRVQLRKQQTLM